MRPSRSLAVVWVLILAYGLFFSALSIQRHRAFLTHASDLGQIDQAIWNTLHGHLLEQTKATGVQNIRLSDHVEPVFIPLSLVFLVYDNVEALLIVQSFAIALGALAVYWIARARFTSLDGRVQEFNSHTKVGEAHGPASLEWAAVGFAAVYLLFPSLEAANLAEFHAVTLAPAPLLFAYHYGTDKAWGRFALFSILSLAVKEEIALLVFTMAAWFAVMTPDTGRTTIDQLRFVARHPSSILRPSSSNPGRRTPLLIALLAAAWGFIAVFVIIPHFNTLGRSPYTCRYVVSEDCRQIVPGLFLDARLGYLGGLLASAGWVALVDPVSLLLGLPLLALNALSNYPAQYSGTYHYSAPVAPYLVLAAIGGSARLAGWLDGRTRRRGERKPREEREVLSVSPRLRFSASSLLPLVVVPVFILALGYHLVAGYTPLGGAFKWPNVSAHNRLFARFAAQIPPDAVVSTTGSLNPHLSHRRVLYRYPNVQDAQYVLLDVSESATSNPIDFRVAYNALVEGETFGVVDAADGYVLLRRGAPPKALPEAFFSIFRSSGRAPAYPVTVDFGDAVRFLGYDVVTDQYGRGSVRMYWQALKPLDKNYDLYLFYADDQGAPRQDITLPSTLLFWYPTSMWRTDETVVGQTVPLDLGPQARLGLGVLSGSNWSNADKRLPARLTGASTLRTFDDSTWVELGTLVRQGGQYVRE
jgi:uncharacterized membrane protein